MCSYWSSELIGEDQKWVAMDELESASLMCVRQKDGLKGHCVWERRKSRKVSQEG